MERIRLAHYLLDLCTEAKEDLDKQIKYATDRQKELGYTVPLSAFGETKYCAFITTPDIHPYSVSEQLDYTYAAASRNEAISVMRISLEYNNNGTLIAAQGKKCSFSDLEREDIDRLKYMGCQKAKDWIKLYKQKHKKIERNDFCPCGSGKK